MLVLPAASVSACIYDVEEVFAVVYCSAASCHTRFPVLRAQSLLHQVASTILLDY